MADSDKGVKPHPLPVREEVEGVNFFFVKSYKIFLADIY